MNQIETLMRQMEAKINSLQESIAAKDTEFAELKASLGKAQQMYADLLVGTTDAIAAKDAEIKRLMNLHDDKDNEITGYKVEIFQQNKEIKRLRDALLWLKENRTPDRAMIEVFIDKTLSPAPVAEGSKEDENGLPTEDEIHFVAVDESNADRHGWISLNQKPAYVDGFEDGAKWMRNKKTT